jgi:hypothetical protein
MMQRAAFLIAFCAFLRAQPEVRVRETAAGPGAARIEAPMPFSALGARWLPGAPARLRVRTSRDGAEWSQWRELTEDGDLEPGVAGLLYAGEDQRFVEYEALEGLPRMLRFVFIDPGRTPEADIERMRAKQRTREAGKPAVISRTEWGCPIPEGPPAKSYTTVTHLIVHHTADRPPPGDIAAWVRAIWAYHVNTNGWADIGYNFLIGPEGTVFEGRAGGKGVVGAHFSCINSGTMGVSVLGNYSNEKPPSAALESLFTLLAWQAGEWRLNPTGRAMHVSGGVEMNIISGHRDSAASPRACGTTECPGNAFYPMLPDVRFEVARRMAGSEPEWTASGLWHRSSRRPRSGDVTWWYGDENTGTYDTWPEPSRGTLESSPVRLDADVNLTFWSWHETEETFQYDAKWVELSVNGGAWEPLGRIDGTLRVWVRYAFPIRKRGEIRVRFRFDSGDPYFNRFEGWHVDEIRIDP